MTSSNDASRSLRNVRTNAIASVMFPQDVVANATLHGIDLGISLRTTQTISSTGIAPITTATSYRAITGLLAGSESFGRQTLTIATRTSDTTGIATQTTIAPDGTKSVTTTTHGLTTLQQQQGGYYAGSSTHWGPEINFGRTLYRAGVRDFGIIKASRGGGGNTNWSKSSSASL